MPLIIPGGPERCRFCGCTEATPCETENGPCAWAAPGVCTACIELRWDGTTGRTGDGYVAVIELHPDGGAGILVKRPDNLFLFGQAYHPEVSWYAAGIEKAEEMIAHDRQEAAP